MFVDEDEEVDISYDAATGTVTVSEHDPVSVVTDCAGCTVTYYTESTWTGTANYDKDGTPVVTGEFNEIIILTWEIDGSESVCTGTYEFTAVLASAL